MYAGKPSSQPVSEDHDRRSQELIAKPQLILQGVTGAPDLSVCHNNHAYMSVFVQIHTAVFIVSQPADIAADKANRASQNVSNLPRQAEDSEIPSNIKYVPSNSKRMDTPATTPEDAPNMVHNILLLCLSLHVKCMK